MFATGMLTMEQFFAQLYAHTNVKAEPATAGRSINAHFATRSLNPDGSWKNLTRQFNSSADVSPTGSQMPRTVGLAYASKLYRTLDELKSFTQFSNNGDEIVFSTIGNACCAEGLARNVNDLANRARANKLLPDEVKGGTFTITNHGISGSLFATPIINQPQCGVLGVGTIKKRVVVIDDAITIRPMVYLSLTFDHRILDGAIADYFLAKVVESLQSWLVEAGIRQSRTNS